VVVSIYSVFILWPPSLDASVGGSVGARVGGGTGTVGGLIDTGA
jgi:hypothetical protein